MQTNRLIADSGSTKTDWALGRVRIKTHGINPIHQSDDDIRTVLREELLPQLMAVDPGQTLPVSAICFYGSGVRPDQERRMALLLGECFPQVSLTAIEAHSDLLGAARALCGSREGLACILGTGANSCLFDGERIVSNIPPLGYILGDEGSGAVLGKRFLNALYKGRLPRSVQEDFEQWASMGMSQIIDRVYRQPLANRWLASLSPFIHHHLDNREVEAIVVSNFRDFIDHNIQPYQRPDLPLQAVGSIAFYYREQLAMAAQAEGYKLGTVLKSPIGL